MPTYKITETTSSTLSTTEQLICIWIHLMILRLLQCYIHTQITDAFQNLAGFAHTLSYICLTNAAQKAPFYDPSHFYLERV